MTLTENEFKKVLEFLDKLEIPDEAKENALMDARDLTSEELEEFLSYLQEMFRTK